MLFAHTCERLFTNILELGKGFMRLFYRAFSTPANAYFFYISANCPQNTKTVLELIALSSVF